MKGPVGRCLGPSPVLVCAASVGKEAWRKAGITPVDQTENVGRKILEKVEAISLLKIR